MNVVYCANGHYIGGYNMGEGGTWHDILKAHADDEREDAPLRKKYCPSCGVKTLAACEHCGTAITPLGRLGGKPSYCYGCSNPFPWTSVALNAANEYTDELESLSTEEKGRLKQSIEELTADTPRTPLAANRFKQMMEKVGPVAREVLSKIVVQVCTEAAKKLTGL